MWHSSSSLTSLVCKWRDQVPEKVKWLMTKWHTVKQHSHKKPGLLILINVSLLCWDAWWSLPCLTVNLCSRTWEVPVFRTLISYLVYKACRLGEMLSYTHLCVFVHICETEHPWSFLKWRWYTLICFRVLKACPVFACSVRTFPHSMPTFSTKLTWCLASCPAWASPHYDMPWGCDMNHHPTFCSEASCLQLSILEII